MKYLILGLVSAGLMACSSSSDSESLASLNSANAILGKASSSIVAVGSVLSPASLTQSALSNCDSSAATDLLTDGSGAGEYLGCLLSVNSMSPDTVLGSFHLVSEIMSMLDGQISFEYGTEYTTHENLSGSIEVSEGTQNIVLSLKERAVSGPWDFHVKLCILSIQTNPIDPPTVLNADIDACELGEYTFEMYLKASSNQLGFKTIERFGSFNGGTSFLIDSATEELRFEGWDDSNGRHTRGYAKGVVSTTYTLSNLSEVSIATAGQGIESSGDGTDALYAEFDGTNLCINSWDDNDDNHGNGITMTAGHGTANLTAQGICASYPSYNAGFFNPVGLEAFMIDEAKGLLDFTGASFGINQYFINN